MNRLSKSRQPWWALALLVSIAGIATALEFGTQNVAPPPGLFDPLSAAEQQRAILVAQNDPQVRGYLDGGRHQLIGASLHETKEPTPDRRVADVQFYRYGPRDVVIAVVENVRGVVEGVFVEQYEPILVPAELQLAKALILAHPEVRERVGDTQTVEILARPVGTVEGPCAANRCIEAMLVRPMANVHPSVTINTEPLDVQVEPNVEADVLPLGVTVRFDLTTLLVDEVS